MNTQITREFRQVFGDVKQSDAFYLFLQRAFITSIASTGIKG